MPNPEQGFNEEIERLARLAEEEEAEALVPENREDVNSDRLHRIKKSINSPEIGSGAIMIETERGAFILDWTKSGWVVTFDHDRQTTYKEKTDVLVSQSGELVIGG